MKVLYARPLIEEKLPSLKAQVAKLTQAGLRPKMNVILVGNNPASLIYVENKKRFCHEVGADFELTHLDAQIEADEFLKIIDKANSDSTITGLFVQLPVPEHLRHIDTTTLINPIKDVDAFGPESIVDLYKGKTDGLLPCTPKGIISLLKYYQIPFAGKNIVIIGRSQIVGKPMFHLLNNYNATVTLCHSKTQNLREHTKRADIIISATGQAKFIDESFIAPTKNQVLIDVGINHDNEQKLCGDCDFDKVATKLAAITPVPHGVGPMTVFSLIENLIDATHKQISQRKS